MFGCRVVPKLLATRGFFDGTNLAGRQWTDESGGLSAPAQPQAFEILRGKPFHWSRTALNAQNHGDMHILRVPGVTAM